MLKKLRHLLEYACLRLFAALAARLPKDAALALGRNIADFAPLMLKSRMALAHNNLRIAFGQSLTPEARQAIIQELLRHQGESLIESLIFSPADMEHDISVEGMQHLDEALARNKGVIVLGLHLGMWELAGSVFSAHCADTSTVYKPMKNPYVNRFLLRRRAANGLGLIPSKNALRMILKRLHKGHAVIMLFDQNAGRSGLPATFFGTIAPTYSAPAAFALKTGCAVLPAWMFKDPNLRRHRVIIGEAFPLISTGNMARDMLANTQQYNDYIEGIIRNNPAQWFGWLHNRWKLPSDFPSGPTRLEPRAQDTAEPN